MAASDLYPKLTSINFTIRNISPQRKRLTVFNTPIEYLQTYDLLTIEGIGEDDIRSSLIKGELANKIRVGALKIVSSSINLLQFDAQQKTFIESALQTPGEVPSGIDPNNICTNCTGGSSDTVVWAPFKDPLPAGAVATWAEAVASVQDMTAPETFIYIDADPDNDNVQIPGGEWNLNNTMIVGPKPQNPNTDTSYRGSEELLYVETESNDSNHCRLNGVRGLKDLYFRGESMETSNTTVGAPVTEPNNGDTAVLTLNNLVDGRMRVGDVVEVNGSGYYRIVAVNVPADQITIENEGYGNSGGSITSGTIVWVDTSVFYVNDITGTDNKFILDNVDFRFGNYRWGTFHVDFNGEVSFKLINAASVRWYAVKVDNYATLQSDGSACWIGTDALFGDGFVDIYSLPGTQFRSNQDISYESHQGIILYIPDDNGNWSGSPPQTVHEALDRLAAACVAAGQTP